MSGAATTIRIFNLFLVDSHQRPLISSRDDLHMTRDDEPPPPPPPPKTKPAPKPERKRRVWQMDEARANIEEYIDDLRQLLKKLQQRWWH
ncbi:hypothetical protein [Bradyrhizobium sp. JR3.5]